MAVTGYDAAQRADRRDPPGRQGRPDAIRDAVAATKDFRGASGVITIDADRNASKPIVVLEIASGGKTYQLRRRSSTPPE